MTLARVALLLFGFGLATGLGLSTRTAAADSAATRTAKRHFERGEKLYALAKFSDALDEYQKAFDARPIPELLFNIGQCYRNLGDYESAIFSYRKYLTLAPEAENRPQVEQLIADLQAKIDQNDTRRLGLQPAPAPVPAPAPPQPTQPTQPAATPVRDAGHPIYTRWWFWTGVAVVVVGTAAGVATYEVTRSPGGPPGTTLGNILFGK